MLSPRARHGLLIGLATAGLVVVSGARIFLGAATQLAQEPGATVPSAVIAADAPGAASASADLAPGRAGVIEGVVRIPERPPRRVANRYPAGGAPAPLPLQDVPAVVYMEGAVAGVSVPPPRTIRIAQKDSTFVPAAVIVPVGGTVAFPNQDPIFHSVISSSPAKRLDLGRYPQGESKSVVFDRPGVVKVYCNVHKHMRSAVVVVENPFNAVVDADGRFRISDVPAGRHTLVIWHSDHDPEEVEVDVPEGGVARVEVTLG
jgi:plastocyanin